ncbi:MAG: hypothetical protein IJO88_05415 [Oscillospiraceae bacterium]|nr:hypothetical protein [Oscillospiraceae bacterium]
MNIADIRPDPFDRGPDPPAAVSPKAAGVNYDGSWNCTCGRKNSSYVSTCACGKQKREIIMETAEQK